MTNNNSANPPAGTENAITSNDDLEGITNVEKYFIHSRGEIIQKLRLLGKSKSSITGFFNNGKGLFLTAVIDVLRDKNILILDITQDPELNTNITKSERLFFKTKHFGITTQFSVNAIQTAKYQGQQFFACQIPENLLWVQRREYFRVQIPLSENAVFQVKNDNAELAEYRIIDLSSSGISIEDKLFSLKVEAGDEFTNANLIFNENLGTTTNLQIANTLPLDFNNPDAGQRIGCAFKGLQADFEAELQRYINILDSHYRKLNP